jgi:hypothetical protein
MRPRSLIVVALLSIVAACTGGEPQETPAEQAPVAAASKTPEDLEGTPWGEIVTLKSDLWDLAEGDPGDPEELLEALDAWYRENDARLRAACLEAARRPIADPDAWKAPVDAFSRWQRDVGQPRGAAVLATIRDPRLVERLRLVDQRCLAAASEAAPTARGAPEDPWARYVALRTELHGFIEQGIPKPGPTLRAGGVWYDDHDAEIRGICRRMAALSGAPENATRIAVYTAYLRTEGQRTVERLVARIPAMVSSPSDVQGLFELMNRFDRLCAEATPEP